MFIAFEGLDGSGSSTQCRLLKEHLEKGGYSVLATKEPTSDTPIGRMIRDILQHKWSASPEGLQLLFSADRAEHIKNEIEPALNNGQIVITDRYLFSTIAFGGMDTSVDWLKKLNENFRLPDITFLFKLAPSECIKRITGRGSEFELFEKQEKLEKAWAIYDKIKDEYPNIHLIDASKSIEEIEGEIKEIINKKI